MQSNLYRTEENRFFLGCQIILNKQLEGMKLILPAATKNFYVDGHKPTPH